jgi:BON domain-containing protein
MVEPLFGSGSSWITTSPPAAAWLQAMATGNRPIVMPPFSAVPSGIPNGPGALAISPPSVVSSATLPTQTPVPVSGIVPSAQTGFMMSPASALMAAEITGITPSGLLAAVAIRRGQPQGPTTDHEVEDFIYDALEWLPGTSEVEVRCEGGRATLTGTVPQKRLKRDVGEVAWAIPALSDVQNNVIITSRRRSRMGREVETAPGQAPRKQP